VVYATLTNDVLRHIPRRTGFPWGNSSKLPVFVSDTVQNSYENPLTLKHRPLDPEGMACDLIHELVHNNLPSSLQYKLPDRLRENLVERVTLAVVQDLSLPIGRYPCFRIRELPANELNDWTARGELLQWNQGPGRQQSCRQFVQYSGHRNLLPNLSTIQDAFLSREHFPLFPLGKQAYPVHLASHVQGPTRNYQ